MKPKNTDRDPIPGQFDAREKQDVEKLWKKSAELSPSIHREPSLRQTEKALSIVHGRLGFTEAPEENTSTLQRFRNKMPGFNRTRHTHSPVAQSGFNSLRLKWIATAAVVLLICAIGYVLIPKTVSVPFGETRIVELSDGSTVELNSGSRLRYNRLFGFRNRDITLDGEAFFSVEESDYPFTITANQSVIEVTGTSFNIRSRSDEPIVETSVFVTEGSVSLYPDGMPDKNVTLTKGDWSRWNPAMENPVLPEPADAEQMTGWRHNQFVFRNEPLWKIFREMERRFDIRIQLDSENMASEILTAHYSNPQNPETMIQDICHVKGLRFAETSNGFRIYR